MLFPYDGNGFFRKCRYGCMKNTYFANTFKRNSYTHTHSADGATQRQVLFEEWRGSRKYRLLRAYTTSEGNEEIS